MPFAQLFAVVVFAALFLLQLFYGRRLGQAERWFLAASAAVVFGAAFYSAFSQYQNWRAGALTRFLLPPHQSIGYFLVDVGEKIFASPLIALLAAIVVPRVAEFFNERHGERFFHGEEFGLMRIGIFLTGYPGFLFYLILVLAAGFLFACFFAFSGKGRAPLVRFWMPVGILTVLLVNSVLPEAAVKSFAL